MQDVEDKFLFSRKRNLLRLRDHLDKLREIEAEASNMEEVLKDPEFAEHHHHALRRLSLAQRALETFKQLVAVDMELLDLHDRKLDLEKELAALDD